MKKIHFILITALCFGLASCNMKKDDVAQDSILQTTVPITAVTVTTEKSDQTSALNLQTTTTTYSKAETEITTTTEEAVTTTERVELASSEIRQMQEIALNMYSENVHIYDGSSVFIFNSDRVPSVADNYFNNVKHLNSDTGEKKFLVCSEEQLEYGLSQKYFCNEPELWKAVLEEYPLSEYSYLMKGIETPGGGYSLCIAGVLTDGNKLELIEDAENHLADPNKNHPQVVCKYNCFVAVPKECLTSEFYDGWIIPGVNDNE